MRGLVLALLPGALVGCDSAVSDCATACKSLVNCVASPCKIVCCRDVGVLCDICWTECPLQTSGDTVPPETKCNDVCSSRSSEQQAQMLDCLTAARSCSEMLLCE